MEMYLFRWEDFEGKAQYALEKTNYDIIEGLSLIGKITLAPEVSKLIEGMYCLSAAAHPYAHLQGRLNEIITECIQLVQGTIS